METQNPITANQLRQMKRDLEEMRIRADEMASLLSVGFGGKDQTTVRAQELSAAIERLRWALERTGSHDVLGATG